MSSFGVIVSGRPVHTDVQVISQTQFAFQIPSHPPFNHIVVFLLPGVTLPDGTAAAVYAQLPGTPDFKLLGAIANEKPSAIFKVNAKAGGGPAGGGLGADDVMVDEASVDAAQVAPLALGISVEPAQQVALALEQKKAQDSAAAAVGLAGAGAGAGAGGGGAGAAVMGNEIVQRQTPVETKVLAQRIIKNCYDFLASWGTGETVPLKAFQAWWTKFEGKIERDPGFLERGDGG